VKKRQEEAGEAEKKDHITSIKESGSQPLRILKVLQEVGRVVYKALKNHRKKKYVAKY